MEQVKEFIKKVRIDLIIRVILLVVMAILFFVNPENAVVAASIVFSIFLLFDGIFSMLLYFFSFGASSLIGTTLIGSIFKIIFGIIFVYHPGMTTVFLCVLFSVYIIIMSCNTIEESMKLKAAGSKLFIIPLLVGIASLIGGIVLLFLDFRNMLRVTGIITGVILIIVAIENIIVVTELFKVKKKIDKAEDNIIDVDSKEIK